MSQLNLDDQLTQNQQDTYIRIVAELTGMTVTLLTASMEESMRLALSIKLNPSDVITDFFSKREWKAYYVKLLEKQLQALRDHR